jgi:hypothetical protein
MTRRRWQSPWLTWSLPSAERPADAFGPFDGAPLARAEGTRAPDTQPSGPFGGTPPARADGNIDRKRPFLSSIEGHCQNRQKSVFENIQSHTRAEYSQKDQKAEIVETHTREECRQKDRNLSCVSGASGKPNLAWRLPAEPSKPSKGTVAASPRKGRQPSHREPDLNGLPGWADLTSVLFWLECRGWPALPDQPVASEAAWRSRLASRSRREVLAVRDQVAALPAVAVLPELRPCECGAELPAGWRTGRSRQWWQVRQWWRAYPRPVCRCSWRQQASRKIYPTQATRAAPNERERGSRRPPQRIPDPKVNLAPPTFFAAVARELRK